MADPYTFITTQCSPSHIRSAAGRGCIRDFVTHHGWSDATAMRRALPDIAAVLLAWEGFIADPMTHTISRRSPRALMAVTESLGYDTAAVPGALRAIRRRIPGCNLIYSDMTTNDPCALKIIQNSGRTLFPRYAIHGVIQFAGMCAGWQIDPMALDGPLLSRYLALTEEHHHWSSTVRTGVRALVWAARCSVAHDPHGRFQSHLFAVGADFLRQYPALWRFPVRLAKRLSILRSSDEADCDHLVSMFTLLGHDRMMRIGKRFQARAYRSLGAQLCTLLYGAQRMRQVGETYREHLFPKEVDIHGLVRIIARLVACQYRDRTQHQPRSRHSPDPLNTMAGFFRVCVRAGLFPMVPPLQAAAIEVRAIHRDMFLLEQGNPDLYCAVGIPTHVSVVPGVRKTRTPTLTTADVARLRKVSARRGIPRERAIFELLATTGLRAGAIQELRVEDVWDQGDIRQSIAVTEKNSRTRYIFPSPGLREALRDHVKTVLTDSALLFPGRHQPGRASACVVRNTLATLCRDAGIPVVNPHSFRAWIVNSVMRAGGRLEDVSRFIGHQQPSVTFRHYWTDASTSQSIDQLLATTGV